MNRTAAIESEHFRDTGVALSAVVDFETFYRRCYADVARALTATLGDREFALEAADEAMSRAYPRWSVVRGYDNPTGWAYRVGLNWARSWHRRAARRLPFRHPEVVELGPVGDPELDAALHALPLDLRAVVVCRYLLDWSIADTAEALDVKPGTVKSRLSRALDRLNRQLAPRH